MAFINNLQDFFSLVTLPTLIGTAVYFGRKLEALDRLEKTMATVKDNIKVISNALISSTEIEFDGTLLKSYSPLTLTPEGLQYLKNVKFIEIFEQQPQSFLSYIDQNGPKTKYDVEQLAVQAVLLHADEAMMQPIKVYLYNNPKDSLQSFAKVAGVYVRDQYLEQHPEITE